MRALADPVQDRLLQRGRFARAVWAGLGLLCVALGIVGIMLPLLPTADFMLLALACFARSSPRLEAWLLNHPRFGPSLRAWRTQGAVPRRAKIFACLGMSVGFVLFWLHVKPHWGISVGVALFLSFWAIWIIRRPEPAAGA